MSFNCIQLSYSALVSALVSSHLLRMLTARVYFGLHLFKSGDFSQTFSLAFTLPRFCLITVGFCLRSAEISLNSSVIDFSILDCTRHLCDD